jgi:hypothetical protein
MSLYPNLSEVGFNVISQDMTQKVLKSGFEDLGKTQVKRKWLYPKRNFSLKYQNILNDPLRVLEQFYMARNGGFSSFTFIMPDTETNDYVGEYVGTMDGSKVAFNLPCKDATGIKIYVDNIEQTLTTNYSLTLSGGADGVDLCTFVSAGSAGARVTIDFSGVLAVQCRFKDTINFDRVRYSKSFNNFSVDLEGLLFDE